jgi:flagellar protein FlgJ
MDVKPVTPVQPGEHQAQGEDAKLRKISQDFEAILLSFLLKSMRKSLPASQLVPQGAGHDLYQQVFDEEIARSLARSRGIGLADVIYRELSSNRSQSPQAREPGQGITLRGIPPREEGR